MGLGKRLFRAPATQRLLVRLAAAYVDFLGPRIRWTRQVPAATQALIDAEAAAVYCFWHGRIGIIANAWPGRRECFHLVVSAHRDGALLARVLERRRYKVVAGSSRRGGATALRGVLAALAAGFPVGITPDGPRGPRMRLKPGAVRAARDSGAPLVAVAGGVARQKRFGSWDRFVLPLPWTEAILLCSEPIAVPADADEALCAEIGQRFEDELNRLTEVADRHFGHEPVMPDARA